jgi:hypothetical protein
MATAPPAITTPTKHALLVGAAHYDHNNQWPNLRTPNADVEAMARVLGAPQCGFTITPMVDPSKQQLEIAISRLFRSAGGEDTVIFYYSGHGKIAQEGGLRLCVKETADGELLDATAVAVPYLKNAIDHTRAKRVILVFDCCYSGEAFGAFKGGDVSSYLADSVAQGNGKFVITSSSSTQLSIELDEDANSLFTKYWIQGLEDWEADTDKDDVIHLDDLFSWVKEKVLNRRPEQVPQWNGYGTSGPRIVIARKPGAVTARATLPAVAAIDPDYLEAVRESVNRKRAIFFLGDGVYGSGPLSSFELIKAIGKTARLDVTGQNCLATAAEYLERLRAERGYFMEDLRDIVADQENQAKSPALYDMLARLDAPWFVVSTTYDLLFERKLEQSGVDFVLLTHVIRSDVPEYNDKVLALRRGREVSTEIGATDKLLLDPRKERIIYKLLGAPGLGDWLDPSLVVDSNSIDTVVVTEGDHVTFLGDLTHKRKSVPTAIKWLFGRKTLLFLGYNLDNWHYRLVANVCLKESIEQGSHNAHPYAVRQPTSSIEKLCWQRLGATLLDFDVDSFLNHLEATTLAA